jgi:hypothetical protein
MSAMTRSSGSEQRLTEALRARAGGAAGRPGPGGWTPPGGLDATKLALIGALGLGVLIGLLLAVLSLAAPGVLPPLG